MTSFNPADVSAFRLSTSDYLADQRVAIWREAIGRLVVRLDFEAHSQRDFRVECAGRILPGAVIAHNLAASGRASRTRDLLTDGNDDVQLMLLNSGRGQIGTARQEFELRSGDAFLSALSEPSSMNSPAQMQNYFLTLKRKMLAPLVANLEDALMRPIKNDNGAVSLLRAYITAIFAQSSPPDAQLRHVMVNHLHDLAALAIGGTADAVEAARTHGVPAARLAVIKADVVRNLDAADISAAWAARRHGISPNYVRRLFQADGISFSEFVANSRLNGAYRLLADSRFHDRTINMIASSVGFTDQSYFNRMFRRRYGATPSDIRAAAREGKARK